MEYSLELMVVLSALLSGSLRYVLRPSALAWLLAAGAPFALLGAYAAIGLFCGQWYWEPGLAEASVAFSVMACVFGCLFGLAIATLVKWASRSGPPR